MRHASTWVIAGLVMIGCAGPQPADAPTGPREPASPVGESQGATDVHIHLDREEGHDGRAVDRLLADAGFARGCVLSPGHRAADGCSSVPCAEQRAWTERANDWTIEQASIGGRLVPFCGVPVGYDWAPAEVTRCAQAGGRGLKLHTARENITLTDPQTLESLRSIVRSAAVAGIPVLIHVHFRTEEVDALFDVARSVPEATIVAAHQLGGAMGMLLDAPPNVWTEISGLLLVEAGQREPFVAVWRAFGVDRVLLGSDWPLLQPADYLDALRELPITDEERTKIERGNFDRLFGRVRTP